MRRFILAAAVAAGAALAYFADPRQGRRRRHLARDKGLSRLRHGRKRAGRFARHASRDAYGLVARRIPHRQAELDDATLAHKVESILFRDRAVPKGKINVNAEEGVVFLRGEVEEAGLVDELEARVRKVRGVRDVENRLHLPLPEPPAEAATAQAQPKPAAATKPRARAAKPPAKPAAKGPAEETKPARKSRAKPRSRKPPES